MIRRAGFALKVISSFVKGLIPLRALVAGLLFTTNFIRPGIVNSPADFFFMWRCTRLFRVSNTLATSFLDSSVASAMYSSVLVLLNGSWIAVNGKAFAFFAVAFLAVVFFETDLFLSFFSSFIS